MFASQRQQFLPRDAMHKRGLCRHAVSVCLSACLSVRLSHSYILSKRIKIFFNSFSPSDSQAILVFPYQTSWQYSDGNSLTGASNAGGVGRNRDSEPIYGFIACCQRCDRLGAINTRHRTTVP